MRACVLQMFFSLGNAYFHLGRLAEAEDAFVMVTLIALGPKMQNEGYLVDLERPPLTVCDASD